MIRTEVLALARQWIGTPFHSQASQRGVGCDCAGLIRGIWRELYGSEPQGLPRTPAIAHLPDDRLERTLATWMIEADNPAIGDVVTFKWRIDDPAGHCGILSPHQRLIHTYWRHSVAETAITPWWSRRMSRVFSFPNR